MAISNSFLYVYQGYHKNCRLIFIEYVDQWHENQCYSYILNIWWFPAIGVPPNHPFEMGIFLQNHPFWGTSIYGNPHITRIVDWYSLKYICMSAKYGLATISIFFGLAISQTNRDFKGDHFQRELKRVHIFSGTITELQPTNGGRFRRRNVRRAESSMQRMGSLSGSPDCSTYNVLWESQKIFPVTITYSQKNNQRYILNSDRFAKISDLQM